MTFFGKIFHWLGSLFENAKKELLQLSVVLVQDIQPILDSGAADFFARFVDLLDKNNIAEDLLAKLRIYIPLYLADEILLKKLTAESTEADVKGILDQIVATFPTLTVAEKAKLWTTLAAKIYILAMELKEGKKITFGEAAALVESAYQTWLNEKNNEDAAA